YVSDRWRRPENPEEESGADKLRRSPFTTLFPILTCTVDHMRKFSHAELSSLVQADRVNRRVYLDPDLFELELERIFHASWIFVGHESQIPNVRDFLTAQVGRQPLLLSRHTDGKVYANYNRCVHRGALVVNSEMGCADRYKCMYHGWTYGTDGRLVASPRQ